MEGGWHEIGGYRALINPALDSPELRNSLADIAELAKSPRAVMLQAGRHRTIRLPLAGTGGEIDVVAKFFGGQSLLKNMWDKTHASKARRTYEASMFLSKAGIGTTPPVACLERWRGCRLEACIFVSCFVAESACFKDMLVELWRTQAPYSGFKTLMKAVAAGIRSLHDAGCSHGDLGNQNVFFTPEGDGMPCGKPLFLDLNRARFGNEPLSMNARARDLSRIWLPLGFWREFFNYYWEGSVPAGFVALWKLHYLRFRLHSKTRKFRHPFRELGYVLHPETAPAQAAYPPPSRQWVWDAEKMRPAPVHGGASAGGAEVPERQGVTPAGLEATPQSGRAFAYLVRISICDTEEQTAKLLEAARKLTADGAAVAIQLLQRPAFLGGEKFDSFAVRIIAACGFKPAWICVGQGMDSPAWALRTAHERDALLATVRHLASSCAFAVLGPAVEAPLARRSLRGIARLSAGGGTADAIALSWNASGGRLVDAVRKLRGMATAMRPAKKIIVMADDAPNAIDSAMPDVAIYAPLAGTAAVEAGLPVDLAYPVCRKILVATTEVVAP